MKVFKRILPLLLLASMLCSRTLAQENMTYFSHIVERGQSLYSIAQMYRVNQEDIIRLNPGCQNKIYAGETLRIPQHSKQENSDQFHTIQSGETLYQLTVKYHVTAQDICAANPGLSAQNFQAGKVIRIPVSAPENTVDTPTAPQQQQGVQPTVKPRYEEMHKVKRRETIFSISRKYKISEEELIAANPEIRKGLKKGMWLCIPSPKQASVEKKPETQRQPTDQELFNLAEPEKQHISTVKAAVLLPFTQDKRMIEYYEGILMAVDSLKRTGTSIDLQVYNTGNPQAVNSILSKPEMQQVNVIFGPTKSSEIKQVAQFAQKYKIRLVIPFSSKENEVFNNPYVYMVNTPQSYIYSEVYEHFFRNFRNMNIVFLESREHHEKDDFIKGLKNEMDVRGISYHSLKDTDQLPRIDAVTDTLKNNIFIPTTGNSISLTRVVPQLTQLTRLHPTAEIHLFGYPEWQTYTVDYLDSFFNLSTYFYSSFYTNNLLPAAKIFIQKYRKWYSKEMAMSYPKYGMLGFDTSFFFLKGLSRYGSELEENLDNMNLTPIQTGFKFQRVNNWGGFVNKKVFFVNFSKNYELIKMNFE